MTPVEMSIWVVALLVGLALLFDFMNGFHDAANSIATVVSTGVLKPQHAVAMAAFLTLLLFWCFSSKLLPLWARVRLIHRLLITM